MNIWLKVNLVKNHFVWEWSTILSSTHDDSQVTSRSYYYFYYVIEVVSHFINVSTITDVLILFQPIVIGNISCNAHTLYRDSKLSIALITSIPRKTIYSHNAIFTGPEKFLPSTRSPVFSLESQSSFDYICWKTISQYKAMDAIVEHKYLGDPLWVRANLSYITIT